MKSVKRLAVALVAVVSLFTGVAAQASAAVPTSRASMTAAESADLAAARHTGVLVAQARTLVVTQHASAAAKTKAFAAVQASLHVKSAAPGTVMTPLTYNANGYSCHWYGYCDLRLSSSNAVRLVDLMNVGAGATALCAIFAWPIGTVPCGVISAILWASGGWIMYLVDTWHSGIFIRVFYTGGGYIWHQ